MAQDLASVLKALRPLQAESKAKAESVLKLLVESGEDEKECDGWKFTLQTKKKSVPFNEKLVTAAVERWNKRKDPPVPEDFLEYVQGLRKAKQAKNPEVVTLKKTLIKTEKKS